MLCPEHCKDIARSRQGSRDPEAFAWVPISHCTYPRRVNPQVQGIGGISGWEKKVFLIIDNYRIIFLQQPGQGLIEGCFKWTNILKSK
jgi:hypothetical protein